MLKKSLTVKLKDAEEIKNVYYHFGYELVNELPIGSHVKLSFSKMINNSKLNKLEKQYIKLNKKFPIAGTIFLILGIIFLILGLTLNIEGFLFINISFYSLCGFMFAFAIYLYIGFLIIMLRKKKLLTKLFLKANKINPITVAQVPINTNTVDN